MGNDGWSDHFCAGSRDRLAWWLPCKKGSCSGTFFGEPFWCATLEFSEYHLCRTHFWAVVGNCRGVNYDSNCILCVEYRWGRVPSLVRSWILLQIRWVFFFDCIFTLGFWEAFSDEYCLKVQLMVAATLVLLCTRPPIALAKVGAWLLPVPAVAIIGREVQTIPQQHSILLHKKIIRSRPLAALSVTLHQDFSTIRQCSVQQPFTTVRTG